MHARLRGEGKVTGWYASCVVVCTNQKRPILMSSSILYHFEWFRREIERYVCDDDEERTQHAKYLLDVMEGRIRSAVTHLPLVNTIHAEPRVVHEEMPRSPRMTPSIDPGVHRIVGGRETTASRSAPTTTRTRPKNAQQRWHLSSSRPRGWSHEINKTHRRRR